MRRYVGLLVLGVFIAISVLLWHDSADDPVVRTVDVGFGPTSAVAVESTGRVFVSTIALNGGVVILDSATGRRERSVQLAPLPVSAGQGVSRLVVSGGQLLLYRPPSEILALDPRTGTDLHTSIRRSSSIVVGGHPARAIDFALNDSAMFVRDVGTRALVGQVRLPRNLTGINMSTHVQRVYATTSDGRLQVLDAYHGQVIRNVHLGAGIVTLLVSEATKHLFVLASTSDDYTLFMLDAESGKVLRTVRRIVTNSITGYRFCLLRLCQSVLARSRSLTLVGCDKDA